MDVVAADSPAVARVLVVADWAVDPYGVLAACRRRAASGDAGFAIVVPARLHGIVWIGDPHASRPCAGRQLDALVRLAAQGGLEVEFAAVGDPDPTAAIDDARAGYAATEVIVCEPPRRFARLAWRARRATGLVVHDAPVRPKASPPEPRRWRALRGGGHCVSDAAQAA